MCARNHSRVQTVGIATLKDAPLYSINRSGNTLVTQNVNMLHVNYSYFLCVSHHMSMKLVICSHATNSFVAPEKSWNLPGLHKYMDKYSNDNYGQNLFSHIDCSKDSILANWECSKVNTYFCMLPKMPGQHNCTTTHQWVFNTPVWPAVVDE